MLFIRHAEKEYNNDGKRAYGLDPPLSPAGRKACYENMMDYVGRYGVPQYIISSPFLRARETADIARQAIRDFQFFFQVKLKDAGLIYRTIEPGLLEVEYDNLLGEYLCNQQHLTRKDHLVREQTLLHSPFLHESKDEYHGRINTLTNKVLRRRFHHTAKKGVKFTCWYITHGYNINAIMSEFSNRLLKGPFKMDHIPECGGYFLDEDNYMEYLRATVNKDNQLAKS